MDIMKRINLLKKKFGNINVKKTYELCGEEYPKKKPRPKKWHNAKNANESIPLRDILLRNKDGNVFIGRYAFMENYFYSEYYGFHFVVEDIEAWCKIPKYDL